MEEGQEGQEGQEVNAMRRDESVLFQHPSVDPEILAQTHELRRIEVTHDPGMSFELATPVAMATAMPKSHVPPGRNRPMPLALFGLRPALEGPRLLVCAQTLTWEVDPLEWLRWLWARAGWRVAVARVHPGPSGPTYELGALRETDGHVEVRRTMAIRSGPRLVRCDASAPLSVWPQWHDALWHALRGFSLGQPAPGPVEALLVHEGPLLGFALPGSWEARSRGSHDTGTVWAAQPVRDAQRGAALTMHARAARQAQSAEVRRASLWRELRESGARLAGVLEAQRAEFAALVQGWGGQWQTAAQTRSGEGVIVLVQREDAGVALDYVLSAPAAGTEHVDWMRATRALDVAIATSLPRAPRHDAA